MALDVGSRLGHYDVTAKIGEGGMGEVYRARDTKLGRDGRSRLQEGRLTVRAVLCVAALLIAPSQAWAQLDDGLIAEATAPLDEDLRDEAMVFVASADGDRRILRAGRNGWICRLVTVPSRFAQCYEGEAKQFFVSVSQEGQPVRDLRANELHLMADGAACDVLSLQPGPPHMSVALVVDTSDVARPALNALRDGLATFLDVLPRRHLVGLIPNQRQWRMDYTTDRVALRRRVDGLFAYGRGVVGLEWLEDVGGSYDGATGWPVFVLVAYGRMGSGMTRREYEQLSDDLAVRGVTVYAITVANNRWDRAADHLTRRTGGTLQLLAAVTALPRALSELATTLEVQFQAVKDRYRVIYSCEAVEVGAEVQIGLGRPNMRVEAFPDRFAGTGKE